MPRWDFECPECGRKTTLTFPRFEDIGSPSCDTCSFWYDSDVKIRRLPSAPAFVLKGSGFHKNDYPSGR